MPKFLTVTSGIPRLQDVTVTPSYYNEVYTVSGTVVANTPITIPNAKTYTGYELEVYLNGQFLYPITDWLTVGSGTLTQVSVGQDLIDGDVILFRKLT